MWCALAVAALGLAFLAGLHLGETSALMPLP